MLQHGQHGGYFQRITHISKALDASMSMYGQRVVVALNRVPFIYKTSLIFRTKVSFQSLTQYRLKSFIELWHTVFIPRFHYAF